PARRSPAPPPPPTVAPTSGPRPPRREDPAAPLRPSRAGSRKTAGNLRSIVVRSAVRPGKFVGVAAWKDKAAWDAHMAAPATQSFREKLASLRNSPADDRFHNSLSVGPLDNPDARGAVYVVTHIDVIPPRKDDAVAAIR